MEDTQKNGFTIVGAVWGIGSERDIQAGISPAGHWVGTINAGDEQIELIVDINRSLDGSWVGEAFQAPIGLDTEPAWDVYLVYERDASQAFRNLPRRNLVDLLPAVA